MKTKLSLALLIISSLSLSGCSAVMDMRAGATQFDLKTVEATVEDDAIQSPVFKNVKTVTVADFSDHLEAFPEDNQRLYRALVKELSAMLEETGEFKVISYKQFKDKLEKLDLDVDITTNDPEELQETMALVGKSLGVHGVVSIGLETVGNETSMSNQVKYMKQLVVDGAIRIDMEARLDMVRSKNSDLLWTQMSQVQWESGTNGLKTTKNRQLKKILRKTLKPLVDQMVSDHNA